MLWCPLFARVKANHGGINSRILAGVCDVAIATGLVKNKANNVFCLFKKDLVVRLFPSFAHYELILNPFSQHCSNKILT